jgi:hypothetical protein
MVNHVKIGEITTYLLPMSSLDLLLPAYQLPSPWQTDLVRIWNFGQPKISEGLSGLSWHYTTWSIPRNDPTGRFPFTLMSISDMLQEIHCTIHAQVRRYHHGAGHWRWRNDAD